MEISPILIPIFALTIPIVALIGNLVVRPWIKLREKQLEIEASMIAEKAAQYAAHNERLEQRVRVLERIATDSGAGLSDEIERLRDAPLN